MVNIFNKLQDKAAEVLGKYRDAPIDDLRNALVALALDNADLFTPEETDNMAQYIEGSATDRMCLRLHPLEKRLLTIRAKQRGLSVAALVRGALGLK